MTKLLAQFGNVDNPFNTVSPTSPLKTSTNGSGLVLILNVLVKSAIVIAGIYALLNFIIAGYGFMSAGGDPKALTKAWERIWQSLIGLLIVAGCLLLAMLFSFLIYGDASIIINPQIFAPTK